MFNFWRLKRGACATGNVYLTKSNFVAGLQCPLRLWMRWHDPIPSDERIESAAMRTGNRVGKGAHALFPGGVVVESMDHAKAMEQTRHLIANASVPAIFEAALEHGKARVRIDILERGKDNAWIVNEVKSSAKVKHEHIQDAALQVWVARGMGLNVRETNIIHIDPSYVRGPAGIEWARLLSRANVAEEIASYLQGIPNSIDEQLAKLASHVRPRIEPSSHCNKPHGCEFWDRCTSRKPKDWIFHLPRITPDLWEELSGAGVERISDIPNDTALNGLQKRVRDCHRSGRPYASPGLAKALQTIEGEAVFFDLEAVATAIPIWPGTRPYERVPFQWSLHHRDATGLLHHEEFLARGIGDPRRTFAEQLLKTIGTSKVPVVVYSSYERQVIDELALNLTDLSRQLISLRGRLFDLLPVVRQHYYHPGFGGSFSIKTVGPTLAPEVDYAGLGGIARGDEASEAFERLVMGALKRSETSQQIRKDLLSYCKLDTLAVVRVQEALTRMAKVCHPQP